MKILLILALFELGLLVGHCTHRPCEIYLSTEPIWYQEPLHPGYTDWSELREF